MNFEDLNKDESIKTTVRHLADKFGTGKFKVKDHWDGDFCAIGLTDNEEKFLVYISTYGQNDFYVSLESLTSVDDLPYEPAGDFDNVDLKGLEKIFAQHLRLENTDTQHKHKSFRHR
jgi:hypothetical protein